MFIEDLNLPVANVYNLEQQKEHNSIKMLSCLSATRGMKPDDVVIVSIGRNSLSTQTNRLHSSVFYQEDTELHT